MLKRIRDLLGVGADEAYSSAMSPRARVVVPIFFFIWMTMGFAAFDVFGGDESFIGALPAAAVGGLVAAAIATIVMPPIVRLFAQR